jgi:hypothetical protein
VLLLHVLLNARAELHAASRDAAAVSAATHLLAAASSRRAAKKVFVISDGYGSSGLDLAVALQQAEQEGVEVVGLTVGFDSSHVPMCYQRWACAALPAALPDALQALYSGEAASGSRVAGEDWEELRPVVASAAATVQEVLQQQASFFGGLVKQLGENKEAKLHCTSPGDLSVDICFCIDATGSMSGWIQACKDQIAAIVTGLVPKISQKHPDIQVVVRWGLVAYRDVGDKDQLQMTDFSEDGGQLVAKVRGWGRMN